MVITANNSTGNYIYDKAIISMHEFNEEFTHFNKIVNSSLSLQESGIIFEFSLQEVKAKITDIWSKFKKFWEDLFEAIKEKFLNLVQKFKKQKVDKAVDELEKNEKDATKEEIQTAYEKLFNSVYTNEDPDKNLWVSYFKIKTQEITNILNTCTSEKVFEKLVDIIDNNRSVHKSDQDAIEKIKRHNEDVEKHLIEPAMKSLEKINKYDTAFNPKKAISDKIEYIDGDEKTYIYPDTSKYARYNTPMQCIKEILSHTPENFYFSRENPLKKTIELYEDRLNRSLNGKIEGDNLSYLMSGLSYDISMMKKQIELNKKLYHCTYNAIKYNMTVVYYLAEKFNVYMGRMDNSDYNKLNNTYYDDAYKDTQDALKK